MCTYHLPIALEYCFRYKHDYDYVFCISGENGVSLLEGFEKILCLLPGLLQVDARGKRRNRHNDLLSWKRLESARFRLKEDPELSRTASGWARPFPRTGGAPRARVHDTDITRR